MIHAIVKLKTPEPPSGSFAGGAWKRFVEGRSWRIWQNKLENCLFFSSNWPLKLRPDWAMIRSAGLVSSALSVLTKRIHSTWKNTRVACWARRGFQWYCACSFKLLGNLFGRWKWATALKHWIDHRWRSSSDIHHYQQFVGLLTFLLFLQNSQYCWVVITHLFYSSPI